MGCDMDYGCSGFDNSFDLDLGHDISHVSGNGIGYGSLDIDSDVGLGIDYGIIYGIGIVNLWAPTLLLGTGHSPVWPGAPDPNPLATPLQQLPQVFRLDDLRVHDELPAGCEVGDVGATTRTTADSTPPI